MPLVRSALIATAACLIGAAAYAQSTTTDQTMPAGRPIGRAACRRPRPT